MTQHVPESDGTDHCVHCGRPVGASGVDGWREQVKANPLHIAYRAIIQANMLAGPHTVLLSDAHRLQRIMEITDSALKTLNSEHTKQVRKALLGRTDGGNKK